MEEQCANASSVRLTVRLALREVLAMKKARATGRRQVAVRFAGNARSFGVNSALKILGKCNCEVTGVLQFLSISISSQRRFAMLKPKALLSSMVAAAALISPGWAANSAGSHPGYVQALSDLRAAHWLLTHQAGDTKVYDDEKVALNEVDAAIAEIKNASIDDGQSLNDHPNVDVAEHGSRLLRSLEILHKAQADIKGEADKPDAKELRTRANHHIDLAIQAAYGAHTAWMKDNKK